VADKFPGAEPEELEVIPEPLLTTVETAEIIKQKPRTLDSWRLRGFGPPYIQINDKNIRYRRSDVLAWIAKLRRNPAEGRGDCRKGSAS
jgi:hypothetical protein